MSKVSGRFISIDSNAVEVVNTDEISAKLDSGGDIEKSSDGLKLKGTLAQTYTFTNLPVSNATPTSDNQLATKVYVDGLIEGRKWKDPVRVLSDSNASVSSAPTSIDGVTLAANDRVALTGQTTASENGIWKFASAGSAMTRPDDFATGDTVANASFLVSEGTNYADTQWTVSTNAGSDTVDTDDLALVQTDGSGSSVTAGDGLTKSGNTINVVAGNNSINTNADDITVNISATVPGIEVHTDGLRVSTDIAGNGLTGAGGAALAVQASDTSITVAAGGISVDPAQLIKSGSAELDGDKVDIDTTFTYITPNTGQGTVTDATHLGAVLAGIDDEIKNVTKYDEHTLTSGEVSSKTFDLPANVVDKTRLRLTILKGTQQEEGVDFTATDGSDAITWTGQGMDGLVAAGDVIATEYV